MLSNITHNIRFYIFKTEFFSYIETNNQTSIVLILSGDVAKDILPRVHHLKYIESVYIYCDKESQCHSLKNDFCKIKSILNKQNELKIALETTLKHHNVFHYYNGGKVLSIWDLKMRNAEFIWFQVLQQQVFLEQDIDKQSKCDFIRRCREYRGDACTRDQIDIDPLENEYLPENVIQEYTKPTFLHRLINYAIRTGDVEELYSFRYFVAHLCRALAEESKQFRKKQQELGNTVFTIYRGQQLSQEEGERLRTNENKYIFMPGFLSTTSDRKVAEDFAGFSSETFVVLFEITVDLDEVPSMVLADVSKYSKMTDENEILFGLNATFEIDEQFRGSCGRWIIRMHATNCEQEIVNDYVRHRQSQIPNFSSSSSIMNKLILAQLLIEMGQCLKAVKFLEKVLPTTDDERANLYYILADAKIASHSSLKHVLDEGIQLLKESENLFYLLNNKFGVANTLRRRADALVLNNQYDKAACIYQEAKKLYRQISNQKENIASCLDGLGNVYLEQQKYIKAKFCYSQVLKWRHKHLPVEHPAIARSYYNIGRYYYCKGNNNENALFYLKEALEHKRKIYPADHPSIKCNEHLLAKVQKTFIR